MARIAKKKESFGTSMGVSSVIAILVILVLVVFAALSITTAKADLTLSQKSAWGIQAYYEADAAAVEMMAEIAVAIAAADDWRAELIKNGYNVSSAEGGALISYTVTVDRNRNLNVELRADSGGKLTRELWQVVPANEWVPDTGLNLFKP